MIVLCNYVLHNCWSNERASAVFRCNHFIYLVVHNADWERKNTKTKNQKKKTQRWSISMHVFLMRAVFRRLSVKFSYLFDCFIVQRRNQDLQFDLARVLVLFNEWHVEISITPVTNKTSIDFKFSNDTHNLKDWLLSF